MVSEKLEGAAGHGSRAGLSEGERSIIACALDCVVAIDQRGSIIEFNPVAEEMFGYSRAEAVGKPLADLLIPPALRTAHRRGLARYLQRGEAHMLGKRVELVALRRDGSELPVEVAVCRIGAEVPLFVGFVRDLTEVKRTARVSHRTRQQDLFRTLVESAPDAMVIADGDGAIVMVNAQTERLFGYSRNELTGCSVDQLVPHRYRAKHMDHRTDYARHPRTRAMGSGVELFGLRKDGTVFPAEISLSPITTERGLLVVSAIRDITERKKAEETQRQLVLEEAARANAERAVRARDDFVAMAGHELKTPLAAMVMQIQSVQRALRTGPPVNLAERLDKVARSGMRMSKLINQLLDVSRIAAGRLNLEPEPLDLVELARDVAQRFTEEAARNGSPVSIRAPAQLLGSWDRLRIDQVITNLVSNAIKYGLSKPVQIEITALHDRAVVRIIDHGLGMDEVQQKKLFGRFERVGAPREYGGLGLGLWITKQIIDASGGELTVESGPRRGSTFTCQLPLRSPA